MPRREVMDLLASEAPVLLRAMEDGLLALERGEEVPEAANSTLRATHTVSSGAALAGCQPMARLAGHMELGLRLVALGRLEPRQHLTDALLQAADVLAAMFARLQELEHVETGGALRALDAALGAGLNPEEAAALAPQAILDPVGGAAWRLSPWLLAHKLEREKVFRVVLTAQAQASGEALYTHLGELLTLGEVLACAPLESGELSLLYASPLEAGLLGEALSLPRELLHSLDPASLGLGAPEPEDDVLEMAVEPAGEPEPPAPQAEPEPAPASPPARARRTPPPAPRTPAETRDADWGKHLVFCLGPETYAVPVELVREILTPPPITVLPLSPEHVLGVMNLRGAVVPVFDLRRRLGLPPARGASPVVVMLRLGGKLQGAMVDSVEDVIAVPEDQVQETPEMAGKARQEYLGGLIEHQGEMIILLDIERLLAAGPVDHAA